MEQFLGHVIHQGDLGWKSDMLLPVLLGNWVLALPSCDPTAFGKTKGGERLSTSDGSYLWNEEGFLKSW